MSEKMMAASRGNRLSGCTEEEATLVRGCNSLPMEDLVKHRRQWSPQGLHNLLRPSRMARTKVPSHPPLGREREHTDP